MSENSSYTCTISLFIIYAPKTSHQWLNETILFACANKAIYRSAAQVYTVWVLLSFFSRSLHSSHKKEIRRHLDEMLLVRDAKTK
jgi:hypothetical protein